MRKKGTKEERLKRQFSPSALAYGDLCRTIRHRKDIEKSKDNILVGLRALTMDFIDGELKNAVGHKRQEDFDKWHRETCEKIRKIYNETDAFTKAYTAFSHGQAQKWYGGNQIWSESVLRGMDDMEY